MMSAHFKKLLCAVVLASLPTGALPATPAKTSNLNHSVERIASKYNDSATIQRLGRVKNPRDLAGGTYFPAILDQYVFVGAFAFYNTQTCQDLGPPILGARYYSHGTVAVGGGSLTQPAGEPCAGVTFKATNLYYQWTDNSYTALTDPLQVAVEDPNTGNVEEVDNFNAAIDSTAPDKDLGKCRCKTSAGVAAAGDPISIGLGNVYEEATDYISGGANKLEFTRSFNSLASPETEAPDLGKSWRHNFDRFLYNQVSQSIVTGILVVRPDGRGVLFKPSGNNWVADSDVDMSLVGSTQTGFTLTDSDDTVETYSSSTMNGEFTWNVSTITYRGGYSQNLSYNSSGQLTAVNDSYGRSLTFGYNTNGQINSMQTPEGTTIQYGYISASSLLAGSGFVLSTVTYPGIKPATLSYQYSDPNNPFAMTGILDENGAQYASWSYDEYGRGLTSQHGGGADLVTVAYNDENASSSSLSRTVTNAFGVADTYTFSMLQNVPKLSQISRAATTTTAAATENFSYDTNGYLASRSDWNGNTTTYTNEARGLPTQIVEASGTSVARTTTTQWDSAFHLPDSVSTDGITTSYIYDSFGNPLTRTDQATGLNRSWKYSWTNALLRSVTGPRTNPKQLTVYGYNAAGAVISVTDAVGNVTRISNTPGGLPATVTDPNGVVTTNTYDQRQRLLKSVLATSAGKLPTSYTYDPAGNLTRVTLPDGSYIGSSYDAAHRVTGHSDALGESQAYTLDALGDPTVTVVYSASGAATWRDSRAFDALGRLIQDVQGAGQTTNYGYDPNGNQTAITDPNNNTTVQAFDPLNRLGIVTDPLKGMTTFSYDTHDRILSVTTPNGAQTKYVYDGFGRRLQKSSPDTGTTNYSYDVADNMLVSTDGAGVVTNRTYDALNRILTTTYPSDPAENVAYAYDQSGHGDGIGRLTSLTDAIGTLSLGYDERGNELAETRVIGGTSLTTQYAYDAASRLAGVGYPSGTAIGYTHDMAGQVSAVSATLPGSTSLVTLASNLSWQPFGPLAGLTYGNGIVEKRVFDGSYRMTMLATGTVLSLGYGYDGNDNVTGITDGISSGNSQALTYDALNRLATAKGGYGNLGWSYDGNGNRLQQTGTIGTYSYAPNSNLLTQYKASGVINTVASDGAGNITGINPASGTATALAYNAAERLATVTNGTTLAGSYTYDAFGRRMLKSAAGVASTFVFEQNGLLLEETDTSSSSTTTLDTVYLGTRLLADINPATGAIYFLHDDRLGTPQISTTTTGAVAWQANYQPFGTASKTTGLFQQRLRLPGQYADLATSFYQNGFRDYMPALGRYVESDPIGLAGGLNTYAYVGNNPINLRDPLGLAPDDDEITEPDPMASIRIAEYNDAMSQLRNIDPNNPQLSTITPPNYVPSQSAIDAVNNAIAEAQARGPSGSSPANACPLQTGGRTISNDTANALNNHFGTNMSRRDIGRALENLKTYNGYGPSDHGTIMSNGDWHIDGGLVDNIGNHIP